MAQPTTLRVAQMEGNSQQDQQVSWRGGGIVEVVAVVVSVGPVLVVHRTNGANPRRRSWPDLFVRANDLRHSGHNW